MQTLTGQYSQLFTRKFLVDYTDFQPSTGRRSGIGLFSLPAGYQVVAVQMIPKTTFAGVGVTTASAKVYQLGQAPAIGSNVSALCVYNALSAVTDYSGVNQWQQPKLTTGVTPQVNFIANKLIPTTIGFFVEVNAGANMNSLTSGEIYIYITTIRLV